MDHFYPGIKRNILHLLGNLYFELLCHDIIFPQAILFAHVEYGYTLLEIARAPGLHYAAELCGRLNLNGSLKT